MKKFYPRLLPTFQLVALLLVSTCVFAQTASIQGTITTADGQAAKSVSVRLKGTSRSAVSDKDGAYQISNLEPATYIVVVNFVGLEKKEKEIILRAGETAVADFVLGENAEELEEVVVSSRTNKYRADAPSSSLRISTPLIETPQNIQVVTKGVLNDQQSFDMLEGIQRNVSGAQKVEHWDNYARINMRGTQITAFRNGMNVQMPWGPLAEDMSMVERIEFVKGPAGFMLANGEPSGMYNVVTKKPSGLEKGEVSFSVGSFDTYRSTIDLDGKLSKNGKLLYRLNLMGQLEGSHRDFEYNNRYSIVPVLKYLLDDRSALTLEYTHQYSEMNVIGSNYAFSPRRFAELPVNFTTAEPNLEPTKINDKSLLAIFDHQFNDQWKLTAQAAIFNYNQVGQSLWPNNFSQDNTTMQRGLSIWDALSFAYYGQIFLNGSVQTGQVRHRILGGINLNRKQYFADWNQAGLLGDSTFNFLNPVYGTVLAADFPVWDRSKNIRERGVEYGQSVRSAYIQDEVGFFRNKLRLTIAGRLTSAKDYDAYSGTTDDSKFTPRVGLSQTITKNTSAYLLYDQAIVPNPGANWEGKSFDPVTGDNFELGLKRDWFDSKWNSTLAAYRIVRNNVLTADLEHTNGAGQFVYSRQSGQQQVNGIELDIKGEIIDNLEVILNYAYTDATITKDSDESVVGNQVAGATKHIQNTWLGYYFRHGAIRGLKLSLGYQYQAGRSSWYNFDNSEQSLPDYFRLDGAISYQKDRFGIYLNVNNLLDEFLYSGAPYYGYYFWQTEPKRNARVSVFYKF